jgi:hypothetical protein
MKHFFTFFLISTLGFNSFAQTGQDTLFYENFDVLETIFDLGFGESPNGNDLTGVIFDGDGFANAAPASRPDGWFLTLAFADSDGENTVACANSWTTQIEPSANFFILPPVFVSDNTAMLYYKSAPFQTPIFLDGFKVLAQVGANFDSGFSDELKSYAEYISRSDGDSSDYNNYQFSSGFVHGSDGLFIEANADGDAGRNRGVLRPDSVSLAQYVGQTIYIAFIHNSTDDNLISIDEILVKGTNTVSTEKIESNETLNLFPNPAHDVLNVKIEMTNVAPVNIQMMSLDGKVVYNKSFGTFMKGTYPINIDVSDLAAGNYQMVVNIGKKSVSKPFVKQ